MASISPESKQAALRDTSTQTRLKGSWLWLARAAWALAALALLVFTVSAQPTVYNGFLITVPTAAPLTFVTVDGSQALLAGLGLSVETYALILTGLNIALSLLAAVAAVLMVWKRSDEPFVLFISIWLVAFCVSFVPSNVLRPGASIPSLIISTYAWITFSFIFYIFPDGRLVPRWSWLVPVLMLPLHFFWVVLTPDSPLFPTHWPLFLFIPYILLTWCGGLTALIYRFVAVASPIQRQQIKWVAYGAGLLISMIVLIVVPSTLVETSQATQPVRAGVQMIFNIATFLVVAIFPLSMSFAILRSNLWNIDFVINRSLAVAASTLLLAAAFAGVFFGLRGIMQAVLGPGQEIIAAVVATAAVMLLFNPARKRLQRLIDERVYGIKLDYVEAVKAYGGTKREARKTGDTKDTFGTYSRLTLLGRGGMGEVYRSQHPTLNRPVAIKILPSTVAGKADAEKRFLREAQTVAKLKHPNIINLYDVGEEDGKPYMVMEYIDGVDLSDLLHERGRLPLGGALPILKDIAAALDYAHQNGIIHRDIKPSNVMVEKVTATGSKNGTRAVLMDFGIAKSYAAGTKLTQTGMIGTLDYISPEQIQGASEVDARADIYSFGVMSYQVLTGQLPFIHNNPGAMVLAHLNQPAPDPRDLVKDLPDTAAGAVMRAMAKKPDQRYATAGEFVAALAP